MNNPWRRATRKEPCAICGKPDWCSVSADGAWAVCRRLETGTGTHKTDAAGWDYWVYRLTDGPTTSSPPPLQPTSEPQRAGPGELDTVYTKLLDRLSLKDQHRQQLVDRGLTDEAIERGSYRSLPVGSRNKLADELVKDFGQAICLRVPGLYVKRQEGRDRWSLAGDVGLVIPVRDVEGRTVALKVRLEEGSPKYRYISSKGHGGPGPGAPCHVPQSALSSTRVRLTEGELKAEVATLRSDLLTISVAGVSAWRSVLDVLGTLKTETVVLSFDADAVANRHVAQAVEMAADGIRRSVHVVELETWDAADGKGIDDLLNAGKTPEVHVGDAVDAVIAEMISATSLAHPTPAEGALSAAVDLVRSLAKATLKDPGAAFEQGALEAISLVRAEAPAEWMRTRAGLISAGTSARELDRVLRNGASGDGEPKALEHSLPSIRTDGRYMREITGDSIRALQALNERGPRLFSSGGGIVYVAESEQGDISPGLLTGPAMKGLLERSADYITYAKGAETPGRVPDDVVADIIHLQTSPFPRLTGLVQSPVVLESGRFVTESGYDPESGYLLSLNGLTGVSTGMPPAKALRLITDELMGDFPFVDEASRTHAVALLLQPFLLPLIGGSLPLYLVDGSTPGVGKGLLVDVIARVAQGRPIAVMSQPKDEEEMRKRTTGLLLKGATMVLLDNVYSIKSGVLSSLLTTREVEDRLLGSSKIVHVRNNATWIATGNNVELSNEITRRTILIRLDPGVERPENRGGFKHPYLGTWASGQRRVLVGACMSLIRAWTEAGMPRSASTLGSFEDWVSVMGGVLEVAGVSGLLENRDQLVSASDRESQEWAEIVHHWQETHGGNAVTAKDLLKLAKEHDLLLDLWAGRSEVAGQQRFGHALRAHRDRVYGEWAIRRAGADGYTNSNAWRLEEINVSAGPDDPEQNHGNHGNTPRA